MNTEPEAQPDDPLFGNSLSGLLGAAMETVQPDSQAVPDKWEPPSPEHIAVLLPQYRIEHLIGRGGMGAVYKGRQITLNRPAAIKVLPAELARNREFVARFHREAQLLASLSHQGIVTIFDFGQTTEGHLYFIMEYVDGTDLHRLIHKSKLDAEQALKLTIQICEALQYAHDMGVIHRDIKPANVLVTRDGRAKLADFGLALKPADHAVEAPTPVLPDDFDPADPLGIKALRITKPGTAMGTPDYAAPEVYDGCGDSRSDIYALGIMLYEMLTGAPPKGYYHLPSSKAKVDARIDRVVVKALDPDPGARFQQASEMRQAVENATKPLPAAAPTPPQVAGVSRPAPRVKSVGQMPRGQAAYTPPPRRQTGGRLLSNLAWLTAVLLACSAAYDSQHGWTWWSDVRSTIASRIPFVSSATLSPARLADSMSCIARARELLGQISDASNRAEIEADIAIALGRAGKISEALTAAGKIEVTSSQWKALDGIAAAQGEQADFAGAITTVRKITDENRRERCLSALVEAQLTQGAARKLAETMDGITTPAGKALLMSVMGTAQSYAGDEPGGLRTLAAACDEAARAADGEAKDHARRRVAVALARCGHGASAAQIAQLVRADPKGDARGLVAIAMAEAEDLPGAVALASSLPSEWARGWAFSGIAKVQAALNRQPDAVMTFSSVPYVDRRYQEVVRLYSLTGDVSGAKVALEKIKEDTRNRREAEEMFTDNLPVVAALIARVDGLTVAETWLESVTDPLVRSRCLVAMAGAWFPRKPVLLPKPKIPLEVIQNLARPLSAPFANAFTAGGQTAFTEPETGGSSSSTKVDPLAGRWRFFNNSLRTFFLNGTSTDDSGQIATWKCLNEGEMQRCYEIIYDGGRFTDRLTLRKAGDFLEGTGFNGIHVTANRMSPPVTSSTTPKEILDDIEGIEKLKEALLTYQWHYTDVGWPSSTVFFYKDGTFHPQWHWKYWVVGPRTIHVQFGRGDYQPGKADLFTFNEDLTKFTCPRADGGKRIEGFGQQKIVP